LSRCGRVGSRWVTEGKGRFEEEVLELELVLVPELLRVLEPEPAAVAIEEGTPPEQAS
jgi:hypothetical protein